MRNSPANLRKLVTPDRQTSATEGNRLWTVLDVAHYLSLNPETVRLMVRRGEIPAQKIGRVWRFSPRIIIDKYSNNMQESVEEQIQGEFNVVKS